MPTCETCGYDFDRKQGIGDSGPSMAEVSFFTHEPENTSTRYFCSSVCLEHELDKVGVQFTEPKGPNPPTY